MPPFLQNFSRYWPELFSPFRLLLPRSKSRTASFCSCPMDWRAQRDAGKRAHAGGLAGSRRQFQESHSLFPTFTMPNSSGLSTGHQLGDTGTYSNTVFIRLPGRPSQ